MLKSYIELKEILENLLNSSESEVVEFKKAETNFDTDKLGRYFSAMSNEATLKNKQYSWIVFGVDDKTHNLINSQYKKEGNFNGIKKQIADNTTDGNTFIEVYQLIIDFNRVVMFQVPAANGTPMKWKGFSYGRDGESLSPLKEEELEQIKRTANYDWTRRIIEKAQLSDLDETAIKIARKQYKIKHQDKEIAEEIDKLSDSEFLSKAKVIIEGKITNAAMILLGKNEKDYLIEDYNPKITWKLYDEINVVDYEHFGIPFIVSVEKVREKIRNLRYRYMVGENSLFPKEVDQYDSFTLRELINNCIVHQNFTMNGPINIMEYKDRLVFVNQGSFIPKNIESVLKNDFSSPYYRNPFLANAMVNFNMIDTAGSGIKRVFNNQKIKFFPMPDYNFDKSEEVKVILYGKIIDTNYSKLLFEKTDLSLEKVLLLDKVQKNYEITKEQCTFLKKENLIEGRYPRIFVSAKIAKIIESSVNYMENKGLDNTYYKDYILDYLNNFDGSSRQDINNLIYSKLPTGLTEEEKDKRVKYLLTDLRRKSLIVNKGSLTKPKWYINK